MERIPGEGQRFQSVVDFPEESNPKYYSLFRRGESLMEKTNELVARLQGFPRPRLRLWNGRKRLRALGKECEALHEAGYSSWELEVTNFLLQPEYHHVPKEYETLVFLHATQSLRDQVRRVEGQMQTLIQGLISASDAINTQEARILATIALIFSAGSILLAVLALLGVQFPVNLC